jgi:DNA-binding beta-propeller fold protein YncE
MIPTLMWLTDGWRRSDQLEEPEAKQRLLGKRPFRTVTLVVVLLLTAVHAGYFLYKFHNYGPDRGGYFDYNFPPVFAKALEQPDRPIYLVDQFYYHVMWQAIVQGVDRSNFVRLLPYNRPPANSIILSGEERCSECEVLYKDIPFILYKTHVGPPKQPEQVKSNKGSEPGQYSKPRGLTEDKDGNYYIADTDNGRVEKFDLNGKFISTFGTLGSGEGEMKEPNGVAVDNGGNAFVTDALNHKLLKFDANGAFVKEWKGPDTGFYGPRDLAFGPNGQLYIIDQGRTRVVIMDTANETFSVWGTMGSADGQLNDPYGIDVSDDKVFVTDLGNNRVQVFDLSGKFIRQWPVPQWEHTALSRPDIIYDSENKRAYVTNTKDKAVLVFDAEGNALEPIKPEPPAELNNPSALVLSTAGGLKHLLVLNTGGDLPGSGEPSVSTILVPSSPTLKPQPKRK